MSKIPPWKSADEVKVHIVELKLKSSDLTGPVGVLFQKIQEDIQKTMDSWDSTGWISEQ